MKQKDKEALVAELKKLAQQNLSLMEISNMIPVASYRVIAGLVRDNNIKLPRHQNSKIQVKPGDQFGNWKVLRLLGYKKPDGTFTRASNIKNRSFYVECKCLKCGLVKPVFKPYLLKSTSLRCKCRN